MLPALLMPALLGGGLGLLANRKDPLKGALLGAGMGAAGGYFAPGLMGGAAGATEAAAAPAMTNGAFLGEGVASGVPAWDKAVGGGLLDQLKHAGQTAAPFASAVGQSGLLGGQDQQMQAPQMQPQMVSGEQTLAALVQQGAERTQSELAQSAQERKKRRVGLLGGTYG